MSLLLTLFCYVILYCAVLLWCCLLLTVLKLRSALMPVLLCTVLLWCTALMTNLLCCCQIRSFMARVATGLVSMTRISGALPIIRAPVGGAAQMLAQDLCNMLRENISPRGDDNLSSHTHNPTLFGDMHPINIHSINTPPPHPPTHPPHTHTTTISNTTIVGSIGPAQALFADCLVSDQPRPLLLIFDRSADMCPPLMHTSTYQVNQITPLLLTSRIPPSFSHQEYLLSSHTKNIPLLLSARIPIVRISPKTPPPFFNRRIYASVLRPWWTTS